ncbi:DUF6458 family protein [Microbacterium sp. SORGH_AS_0888]|uniref:DUF6458 family protein n=1 Tax=Microbacterium sp. SORGH_AS_0888 TaxID=3041791 RepID=UPI0027873D26|nr:DUF6458 family protein [Microbacterium sp. SORGH_AS_0888]MDQ1130815.1 membrane-bound ClpP family serine protease [Microbacterium sp. SORGH_AS_0888]
MSIGAGIALIVIGAILAFALDVELSWVDLHLVGYILIGAGVVVALLGIVLLARKRTSSSVVREVGPGGQQRVTEQSTRTDEV